MSCGCPYRFHPAQRQRACSLMCSGAKWKRRGSWEACGGGRYVLTTKGAFWSWIVVLWFRRVNRGHSIDAEWIMEKKDWRQSTRQGRDAAGAPAGSSNTTSAASPANGTSPSRNQGTSADGADDDTDAYQPEMDEVRCLLWAHGGSFHVRFLSPSLF